MSSSSSRRRKYDEEDIKKGPWKAEEDEVLRRHVKMYGPREWSSLQSNGLLHRTGKSCRLRWVNKLRPNLKIGVKFSAEEEMTVIELQSRFGNKWARIATYLPGRTDNDVKNFWSSRQKRLARIPKLPSSSPQIKSPSEHQKNISYEDQEPKHSMSTTTEKESSSKAQPWATSQEAMIMAPLPELIMNTDMFNFEDALLATANNNPFDYGTQLQLIPYPDEILPFHGRADLPLSLESQQLIGIPRIEDPPDILDVFEHAGSSDLTSSAHCRTLEAPCFGSGFCCGKAENESVVTTSDSFIYDFPMDMFDSSEQVPSP